jgi:DNA-binding GntR family transcriptional regulator
MTDNLKLEMSEYLPLRDVVFKTLREAILRGELQPGERLMEVQLAKKLGVSRTPIREAIRMLEQEGLAVTIPRRGAEVAKMTLKDMEDVLEIREALDELAVQIACTRITEEQLEELQQEKVQFEMCTQGTDVRLIAEADMKFHDVIYKATGNPKLVSILNNLREQLYRYRVEYLKDAACYPVLIQEHETITESLKARDINRATRAMHEHVANQAVAVKGIIQKQDELQNKTTEHA